MDILTMKVLPALSQLSLNSSLGAISLFSPEHWPERTETADRGLRAWAGRSQQPAGGAQSEVSQG